MHTLHVNKMMTFHDITENTKIECKINCFCTLHFEVFKLMLSVIDTRQQLYIYSLLCSIENCVSDYI